jgi:tetratricopeptide (TPR) repeat protein
LGRVAEELREYGEARQYYQQAITIFIEFGDRYSQAGTYGQLELLAKAENNLTDAGQNLLQALEIFAQFQDQHSVGMTVSNLSRIYQIHPRPEPIRSNGKDFRRNCRRNNPSVK